MQIRKGKPPASGRLARTGVELSREARVLLAWMDFHRRCRNVAHTCRQLGISRQTFYRWQRRYDPYDLIKLEERSHCPRRCRQPTWTFLLEEKVFGLRLRLVVEEGRLMLCRFDGRESVVVPHLEFNNTVCCPPRLEPSLFSALRFPTGSPLEYRLLTALL